MSIPPLPPQAYTRDTVVEAFNWLQTQPESVRQLAKSEDALVSLYLRAKRFGGVGSPLEQEAPVSSRKFKSDLKDLAKGLKDFDSEADTPTAKPEVSSPKRPPLRPSSPRDDARPTTGSRPRSAASSSPPSGHHLFENSSPSQGLEAVLDPLSHKQVRRAMDTLNISSEDEALRVLITVGAQQIHKLFD